MAKDEEYHFKDAESPHSYTMGPAKVSAEKERQAQARRRKLITMSLLFFVLWGGYKLISYFIEQAQKNPKLKPATVTTHRVTTKPTPVVTPQAPISPILNTAPQEVSSQKARIDNLEAQIVNLQSALNDTTSKINDLSTEITTLTDQLKKPPAVEPPPIKIKAKKIPPPPKIIKPRPPPYTLQAAILGRAWLKRSNGTNVTVTVGDKIPGYGVVILIDPNEGLVQTSTGAIIKYK